MSKDINFFNTGSPATPNTPKNNISQTDKQAAKDGRKLNKAADSLAWLNDAYNSARGETSLWVAVITQAMMDALSRCKKTESIYQKHEATRWLTSNSKDFINVCLCAGMDPDYVRRKAKNILSSPRPWRAQAGQGKRYEERRQYRENRRLKAKKLQIKNNTAAIIISLT